MPTKSNHTKRVRRDRREEIIEKATQLFAEYGYKGTSFALVANAVGLTEQGVLHYFPSKVHLLQAVLENREDKEVEKYSKHINGEKKNVTELFSLLEEVVGEGEEIPSLIQLFTVLAGESIRSDHPSHDYFVERYRRGRKLYVTQFLTLNEGNLGSEDDLEELASLIMAVMDGLQIQWLLDPENVDMVASFKLFSKIVSSYLKK